MTEIVTEENPVLRGEARVVSHDELQDEKVRDLIVRMKEALAGEQYGVAIAAPQIGESVRIFVVSGRAFASINKEEYAPETHADAVFINPTLVRVSKKQSVGDEGCLSVPGKYGIRVPRAEKVTLAYTDEAGVAHEEQADGLLARIFQHEIDHLDGTLYTDRALEVIDVDDDLKPIAAPDA